MMQPDKNLHAAVSPALLTQLEQAALHERVTVDDFITDAIKGRLQRHELASVLAFGKRHAAVRGLVEDDISGAIADERHASMRNGH